MRLGLIEAAGRGRGPGTEAPSSQRIMRLGLIEAPRALADRAKTARASQRIMRLGLIEARAAWAEYCERSGQLPSASCAWASLKPARRGPNTASGRGSFPAHHAPGPH